MSGDRVVLCICGGGNGAHVLATLAAAHAQTETRVLTLFQDEAERWNRKLQEGDMIVTKKKENGQKEELKTKADQLFITNDASKAVTDADVIILCVPSFAHESYLVAMAPFVKDNAAIIGMPGQAGFEFQVVALLKDKAKKVSILDYETLPWACRITEFGRNVDLLVTKSTMLGSWSKGNSHPAKDPHKYLQSVLGEHPVLSLADNYLETLLMTKSVAHPAIMMGSWQNWDGKPVSEPPLFYQGLSEEAAALFWEVSEDAVETARAFSRLRPDVSMKHVEHIEPWLVRTYSHTIQDTSSLYTVMRTNTAYDGLVHPMKEVSPGQFMPDFHHRYLSEDVPYGITVIKGVAQIIGYPTPATDRVINWCQGHLGKEYLVGSELKGKDVGETRAPQAFGMNTMEDLLALL